MKLYELLFAIFILYLLYKLVFNVVVPVSKATATVRDRMRQMQEEQNQQQAPHHNTAKPTNTVRSTTTTDGEYIDFEEVK